MKKFTMYEQKDLENFDKKLFYFLQGDSGFLERNGSYKYLHGPIKDETLFLVSKKIQEAGLDETEKVVAHIENRLKYNNEELEKALEKVEYCKAEIHKYEQLNNMVKPTDKFKDVFELIAL